MNALPYTPDSEQDSSGNVWAATEYLQLIATARYPPGVRLPDRAAPSHIAERFNLSHAKAEELINGIAKGGAPRGGLADTDEAAPPRIDPGRDDLTLLSERKPDA